MDKNQVKNEMTEVPSTKEMNDRDILNDVLLTLKNITNSYSVAIDEMSNKALFKEMYNIFDETKTMAREAYDLAFKNGWYTLEKAEEKKIDDAYKKASKQLKELG